jgi:hypothetical protein
MGRALIMVAMSDVSTTYPTQQAVDTNSNLSDLVILEQHREQPKEYTRICSFSTKCFNILCLNFLPWGMRLVSPQEESKPETTLIQDSRNGCKKLSTPRNGIQDVSK